MLGKGDDVMEGVLQVVTLKLKEKVGRAKVLMAKNGVVTSPGAGIP